MTDPKDSKPHHSQGDTSPARNDDRTLSGSEFGQLPARQRFNPPISSFLPNDLLAGRFKILRFVARGGMGEVYEAEDQELNERVALKTVRLEYADQERAMERFKREIQLARKVTHPNVCRTFDVFRHSETGEGGERREVLIVSMELLSGVTLDRRLQKMGRFTAEQALPLVEQMTAGLSAAHRVGVIHRDFKCSNVILEPPQQDGGLPRVVITDFGLAHPMASEAASLTGSLDVVGTPAYMAPEQLESGEITPATDVYALGIVIFEMLTGKLPFKAETAISAALLRLREPAPSPKVSVPDLDPKWESVVGRCLERLPSQRFSSADDVFRALRGEQVTPAKPLPPARKKQPYLWPAVMAAVVLLAVIGYLGMRMRSQPAAADSAPVAAKGRLSLAILGFQNRSERQESNVLGDMLTDSLWSQLDVDEIRFITPSVVDDMKHNLGIKGSSDNLSREQLGKIGEYLGCDVLVTGSYRTTEIENKKKMEWNIHLVRTKDNETRSLSMAGEESDLTTLAARAGRQIRDTLKIQTDASEEARLNASLSASPDALRYFSEARQKRANFEILAAAKLLEKSVAADPHFAQAHSALAESWADLGYEAKAQEASKKAFDLSSKLSAEERGLIAGRFYDMTHDWTKAIQNYSSLWILYSDEPEYGLLLAKSQINAGKGQAALGTLAQMRKSAMPAGIEAQADMAEADAQEALSNYQGQFSSASAAAAKAQSLKANLLLARAKIQQCTALVNLGEPQKAKPQCEEARKLNQDAGDQLGTARATNVIANVAYQQGDISGAGQLYQQALGIAETIGDKMDEAGALNNLANLNDPARSTAETRKLYESSIRVASERGDGSEMAIAEQNLASFLYLVGDPATGKDMFNRSIKLAREIGDKKTEARALNNLCMFTLRGGDVKQALKNCRDSLQLRMEINDKADIASSYGNRGDVLFAEGDVAGAKKDYEDALKIRSDLGQKGEAAYLAISLGTVAVQEKAYAEARKNLEDAASELAAEKDPDGEALARTTLAELLLEAGHAAEARTQIDLAMKSSRQSTDASLKIGAAIVEARVDAEEGRSQEAGMALLAVEKEAHAAGLLSLELQARLARGEVELKTGKAGSARAVLASVAQDAKAKGFGLIAKKAASGQ